MQKKTLLKIIIPVGIVSVLLIGTFAYLGTYYKAKDVDSYLESNDEVNVEKKNGMYVFDNVNNNEYAFIFYPGAKVDEKAYAPILRGIADRGIDVYLCSMPFHFAFFDADAAGKVFKNSNYTSYYIGGHSLGGVEASSYASKTKNDIKGIVYLASYSAVSLKNKDIKALSIYGSNDGVLKINKAKNNVNNFQDGKFTEVVIEGGNHGQFGSYGKQSGDNDASISMEEQKDITVNTVVNFIKN